jgi:adenylate cyclase
MLLKILDEAGRSFGQAALAEKAAAWFFEEHEEIAGIASFDNNGTLTMLLLNERFLIDNDLENRDVEAFLATGSEAVTRAASGELLLRNAGPVFGVPVTGLFFPRDNGAALVLFSSDSLADNYGSGTSTTYLINADADIIVHPNTELVIAGVNAGNQDFIRNMRERPQASIQSLYTDEEGNRYFGAYTKLALGSAVVVTAVEYNKVFEGVAATTRRNIYLTAAVLFIAGILIWLFSKTISTPMKGLTAAAEQIEGGQFEVTLKAKSKDEIGVLTESFGKMSNALGIFGRFTNREIAVRAMRGEIKPGGLPRHGTIFFSDIRGFTEKSENFTKEYGEEASDKIVYWLNDYFTRMVECVEKTNGVVDKFIGDAVMAHWGTAYTAGSPEEDAFNCITTALMMRAALLEMNKNRSADDPRNPPIRIGCGINTGMVTAGQIGSDQRMEYTVIGDPVNLASRTEALNKPLGTDILITENTWNLIGKRLVTEEMPPVRVKGKEKPVRMFAVINLAADTAGPQTLAELRTLLGIEPPDLSKVDTGAEEQKYKIG